MPFLEIVTRCYKRPHMLARNIASLEAQTASNWRQTFLPDDEGRGVPWANANLGAYAPALVGDYVWVLDDDDMCSRPTLCAELEAIVASRNPDVIMIRGDVAHLRTVPDKLHWRQTPQRGHVGMPCFIVRRDVWQAHAHAFTEAIAADYSFIAEVFRHVPAERIYWHDVVGFEVQRISAGAPETGAWALLTCVWNRPERLERTLSMLESQLLQIFDVYLINNNATLRAHVDDLCERSPLNIAVQHNAENHGSFARLEKMHELSDQYQFFTFLDDDADIAPDFTAKWWNLRDDEAVQSWMGFRFRPGGTYWERDAVPVGREAHYLFGCGNMVPGWVGADEYLLALDRRYWMAEDLWLSYYANHVLGLPLRRARQSLQIVDDGKDSYAALRDVKVEMLDGLRGMGWAV